MANEFPEAMPRPWTAEVGERLSLGGGDCWVIDSAIGSVAEMQCGIDRERDTAKFDQMLCPIAGAQTAIKIAELRAVLHPQPEEEGK